MTLVECMSSELQFGFVVFYRKIPEFGRFQGLGDIPWEYQVININPFKNVFLTTGGETNRVFN